VGTKTAALLRQRFARVSELAHATEEDVVALGIGRRRAQAILEAARLLASEEQSS
jgi:3-methyladenine DNA glycosylase/8-oxoguanine DNA glycosylase